jgi:DNA-directed primase/polymerase protein
MSSLSWRDDSPPAPKPLSAGIPPSSFHKTRKARDRLQQTLDRAAQHVVREQRRTASTQLTLKRSAYKELTSLQIWPLQELALVDLEQLVAVHLGKPKPMPPLLPPPTSGHATDDSSSSCSEEGKRTKIVDELSPRKSTLRHQFKVTFQQERDLPLRSDPTLFSTALYCMEPRILCKEVTNTGTRKYYVGHLGRFMDHYWRKISPEARHYYELIQEQTPCRLYFDLEFSKPANPEVTPEESELLMEEFCLELCAEVKRIYDLDITRTNMVDLESSTAAKFSRHIIVHFPNDELFPDNVAAGRFVKVFIGRLAEDQATGVLAASRPTLNKLLFVNAAKSSAHDPSCVAQSCFVDLGVYTRNRLFRLLGSSKFGKPASAALRIATANQFPLGIANAAFYVPEIVQSQPTTETAEFDTKAFLSSLDFTEHAAALTATLVVPMNVSKIEFPILPESPEAMKLVGGDQNTPTELLSRTNTRSSTLVSVGASPFPSLDAFIHAKLANRQGVQGAIRGWSIDCNDQGLSRCITYQMSRNRWCESVLRSHKSNNIMWMVDLIAMEAAQGCHDPECRMKGFRGRPVALPEDVKMSIEDVLFEEHLAKIDEKDLLAQPSGSQEAVNEPAAMSASDDTVVMAREPVVMVQSDEFSHEFENDEEFERALLALDLNSKPDPVAVVTPSSTKANLLSSTVNDDHFNDDA